MNRITVAIAPERTRTRILASRGPNELMRAVLGPPAEMHPRAATTLLEGLALWHHESLDVVLCVSETSSGSELGLFDALEFGTRNVHFEVGIALGGVRRGRSLGGLGDFRVLQRMVREGGR